MRKRSSGSGVARAVRCFRGGALSGVSLCLFFLLSCGGSEQRQAERGVEAQGSDTSALTMMGDGSVREDEDATTVEWSETVHDFGTVQEGEVIERVFTFVNTGNKPMLISNASSTCGCTVPEWPKDEILPRQRSEIRVRFDTTGKGGRQDKKVWITANTNPAISTLVLRGDVVSKRSVQSVQ